MKLNNKGIGLLDTLTSLIIIIATVVLLSNFSKFSSTSILQNRAKVVFYQNINNTIALGCIDSFEHDEEADIFKKSVRTNYGVLDIECKITEEDFSYYKNEKSVMHFKLDNLEKEVETNNISLK